MRKVFSLLLAVVMLAVPVLSFAASPKQMIAESTEGHYLKTTFTMQSGAIGQVLSQNLGETTAQVVVDLIDALGFRMTNGQGRMEGALTLSGKDAISFDSQMKDGVLLNSSSLTGGAVQAFTQDEFKNYCMSLLGATAGLQNQLTGETAASSDINAEALVDLVVPIMFGEKPDISAEDFDLTPLQNLSASLDSIQPSMVSAADLPDDCDPAMAGISYELTEDLVTSAVQAVADVILSNQKLVAYMDRFLQVLPEGQRTTVETLLKALPGQVKDSWGQLETPSVEVYMSEESQPVAIRMNLKSKAAEGEDSFTFNYLVYQSTKDDGVYTNLISDGTTQDSSVHMTCSMLESDTVTDAVMNMDDGKQTIAITAKGAKAHGDDASNESKTITISAANMEIVIDEAESATKTEDGLATYTSSRTIRIPQMDPDRPLLTVWLDQEVTDEAPADLDAANAVHPGAMSEEELQAYNEEMTGRAQQSLMSVLMLLPESAQNLVFSMFRQ